MGTPAKALIFGAGLFLTLALIGLAVNVFSPSTDAAKTATTDFSNTTTELKDQKYLIYDNTVISGSQVVNALRKFEEDAKSQTIALKVETGKSSNWYFSQFAEGSGEVTASANDTLSEVTKVTSNQYVNPSGNFNATVKRDSNGVIRAIEFVQK